MVLHWNQCSKRITKVRKKYEYSSNLTLKFVVIVKILHLNLLSIYGNNNAMTNVIHFSFANVAACTIRFTYNRVECLHGIDAFCSNSKFYRGEQAMAKLIFIQA
jgi:hypothetical protein